MGKKSSLIKMCHGGNNKYANRDCKYSTLGWKRLYLSAIKWGMILTITAATLKKKNFKYPIVLVQECCTMGFIHKTTQRQLIMAGKLYSQLCKCYYIYVHYLDAWRCEIGKTMPNDSSRQLSIISFHYVTISIYSSSSLLIPPQTYTHLR